MTESEKQQIVNLVLQSLKTNSLTIEQLTSITELPDDAYIEVSGGCKISCGDLKKCFNPICRELILCVLMVIVWML